MLSKFGKYVQMNKYGIKCYIIDDFGYVFLSGDELDLGRHISDVDGPLFHSLSRKDKIFKDKT